MRVGGNKNMRDFFARQGFPANLTIEQKYKSEAAALYRDRIKALAEGADPASLKPIPIIGYMDADANAGGSSAAGNGGGSSGAGRGRFDSAGSANARQERTSSYGGFGSSGNNGYGDDDEAPRPKMQGFGSSGQSYNAGSHAGSDSSDFFSSLSSSFFSAAKYTQAAVAQTAAVVAPKLQAAGQTLKQKTVETTAELKNKDLVAAAAAKTAQGWSALTGFVNNVVSAAAGDQQQQTTGQRGKYAAFGSDSLDENGNPRPSQLSDEPNGGGDGGGLFFPRPEGVGTGRKYEGMGSEAFGGFGDDGEDEPAASVARPSALSARHSKSPSKASSRPSVGATHIDDDNEPAQPDDPDEWGWDAPKSKSPASSGAAPARKTSSSSLSSAAPSVSVSAPPPAVRKSSSGSSFGEEDSPTKQLRGMKLTASSPSPSSASSTASASAAAATAASARPKKTSILAQIHDEDAGKEKKDDFEGFDDW